MSIEIREIDYYGPAWIVERDGKKVTCRGERAFSSRDDAVAWAEIVEQMPAGYWADWHVVRSGSISGVSHWTVVGPDGSRTSRKVTDMSELPAAARAHAVKVAPRVAVVADAEETVRVLAEKLDAPAPVQPVRHAPLVEQTDRATERQVACILRLLATRERNGDSGGFIWGGPTDAASIRRMSRAAASTYITSLREEY